MERKKQIGYKNEGPVKLALSQSWIGTHKMKITQSSDEKSTF